MSAAAKLKVDGQEEKRPYKPGSGGKSIHPPRPQKLLTYVRMFQQTADSRLPLQFLVICEQRKVKGQRQNQTGLARESPNCRERKRGDGNVVYRCIVLSTRLLNRCRINK